MRPPRGLFSSLQNAYQSEGKNGRKNKKTGGKAFSGIKRRRVEQTEVGGNMQKKFRLLRAEEIEVKVKQATEKGAVALVYKTSRVDMDILDETVGPENWADDYREIHGNLYCGIGIRGGAGAPFVWKWDCGIESREDAGNEKKGEASDAFKRAGVKWGIGRELYTAPFIFLPVPTQKDGGRYRLSDPFLRYDVTEVEYDDARRIRKLVIADEKGKAVFSYPRRESAGYGGNVQGRKVGKSVKAPKPEKKPETAEAGDEAREEGCSDCNLCPEDWEKIGYTREQLEETVFARTGKHISELEEKECGRLRDWIDKVYEKRLQTPFPDS